MELRDCVPIVIKITLTKSLTRNNIRTRLSRKQWKSHVFRYVNWYVWLWTEIGMLFGESILSSFYMIERFFYSYISVVICNCRILYTRDNLCKRMHIRQNEICHKRHDDNESNSDNNRKTLHIFFHIF